MPVIKENVIYLNREKIVVYKVGSEGSVDNKEVLLQSAWTKDTLKGILDDLKSKFPSDKYRLLLSESLVFTASVPVLAGEAVSKESIKPKAQALVSDDLDKTVWDIQEFVVTGVDNQNLNFTQVTAVVNDYFQLIEPIFNQSGITISNVESISAAFAKQLVKEIDPVIIVYGGLESLITLCYQGRVFTSLNLIPVELSNKAKRLKDYAKKNLTREVKHALLVSATEQSYTNELTTLGLQVEDTKIDPVVVVDEDIKKVEEVKTETVVEPSPQTVLPTETPIVAAIPVAVAVPPEVSEATQTIPETKMLDGGVPNAVTVEAAKPEEAKIESPKTENYQQIWEEKQPETNNAATEAIVSPVEETPAKSNKKIIFIIIAVVFLILSAIIIYLILNSKNTTEPFNPLVETTVSETNNSLTNTASNSAVLKSSLKISVQNGSGVAGEAAKVKVILETAGFKVESVGNASSTGAIKTEIKSKTTLPDSIKSDFETSLSKLYDLQFVIGETSSFDVVITVGKLK